MPQRGTATTIAYCGGVELAPILRLRPSASNLTLNSYDTQPSVLTHPITSSITRSPSGEADSKRAKLTPPSGPATIASLVQHGAYDSLQALEKDVENAITDILASSEANDPSTGPSPLEESTLQVKIFAFQKVTKSLVEREEARRAQLNSKELSSDPEERVTKGDRLPTPVKSEEEEQTEVPRTRTVLTLLGQANSAPKHLFSSLQQTQKVAPTGLAPTTLDTSVQITLPLRESSLPNIMSTTEIYPLPDQADAEKKKTTTIGNVFRAPAHLPQISPPKVPRPTTGKSHTITFGPPEKPKPSRKGSQSYAHQNQAAGFWLSYAGVDVPKDQASPTARQKSRQRALSMGESQQPPSEATLVAVQQAKEDALFRSAYSSFAPTRDDATAIVPEETKKRVWWQRVGEKRFNEMFPIDPALLDAEEAVEGDVNGVTHEDDSFKDVLDNFIPVEGNPFLETEKSEEEKGTDEVLLEVSELLETLASYQRIRNSSLTTNPRTPVVQNTSLASLAGSPSQPSTEEFDVYQILKSQLSLLVSQLPPYAVAKLNGDQLEELNISRTILFDTKEYKGVLEEDTLSRLAKAPPMSVATPATLARTGSGMHTHYPAGGAGGTQSSRPSSSVHQSGARPVQPAQSLRPQQQPFHGSSMLPQRSPSGPTSFQPGGVSYAPSSRSYSQSYSQQTPRPSFGQTQASSGQHYFRASAQPTTSYGVGAAASSYHVSTPATQPMNRYATQPTQSGYTPRPQNMAPMYNPAQTPQARTASPMKVNPTPAQSTFGTRPSSYGTPVAGAQMRSAYYGASQYGTPQSSTPAATFNGLPANPQQSMIDRQQAAQAQARLAAQSSFSSSRQGSGTPQPPNGGYNGQANGTSMLT